MEIDLLVREIQYVVAPAVMTSGSALLLLGFQNKFSSLANRFRALNSERRELLKKASLEPREKERCDNLTQQVAHLLARATHVKNAILMTYAAIALFLLTSVLIFFNARGAFGLSTLVVGVFLLGLMLELLASVVMMREVGLAFKVVDLEARS